MGRYSAQKDYHISESDSENDDVDEENIYQNDNNDFSLSRPARKIKRPDKLKDYEVGYQSHGVNIAYLTQVIQQNLEQTNFDED